MGGIVAVPKLVSGDTRELLLKSWVGLMFASDDVVIDKGPIFDVGPTLDVVDALSGDRKL